MWYLLNIYIAIAKIALQSLEVRDAYEQLKRFVFLFVTIKQVNIYDCVLRLF